MTIGRTFSAAGQAAIKCGIGSGALFTTTQSSATQYTCNVTSSTHGILSIGMFIKGIMVTSNTIALTVVTPGFVKIFFLILLKYNVANWRKNC